MRSDAPRVGHAQQRCGEGDEALAKEGVAGAAVPLNWCSEVTLLFSRSEALRSSSLNVDGHLPSESGRSRMNALVTRLSSPRLATDHAVDGVVPGVLGVCAPLTDQFVERTLRGRPRVRAAGSFRTMYTAVRMR